MTVRLKLVSPSEPAIGLAPRSDRESAKPAGSFQRRLETPPALPWRQRQMAELDARFAAPAPIERLSLTLTRETPWRPGAHGRFLVTYTHADADARPAPAGWRRLLPDAGGAKGLADRSRLLLGLAIVSALALPYLAVSTAFSLRQTRASALSDLEQSTQLAERRIRTAIARARDARMLNAAHALQLSPGQVLQDLAWLSAHRKTDVTLSAVHWAHGISAVEVSSETPPFDAADRRQERAPRALRPGVWLWGVATSAAARP